MQVTSPTPPLTEAPTKPNEEPIFPSGSLPSLTFSFICDPILTSALVLKLEKSTHIYHFISPILVKVQNWKL